MLHVVAHMYNGGVQIVLAYQYYVIAPALQPISTILIQAFHKLEPECYRNGVLQHIACPSLSQHVIRKRYLTQLMLREVLSLQPQSAAVPI